MTNHTDRMMLLLVQLLLANLVKCEQLYTGLDLASNSSGIHSVTTAGLCVTTMHRTVDGSM